MLLALVVQALALLALTAVPASAAPLNLRPGDLVISDTGNDRLVIHPDATGNPDRYLTGISRPGAVVVTPGRDIVVVADGTTIVKIAADGERSTLVSTFGVDFLALDGDHVLYSGSTRSGIGRVGLDGTDSEPDHIENAEVYGGIAVDPRGDVVGVAQTVDQVHRIHGIGRNPASTPVPEVSKLPAQECHTDAPACNLRGLALTQDDRIVVADTWNDKIWETDGAGGATSFGTGLNDPSGVAVADGGTVYATDQLNHRVLAFGPDPFSPDPRTQATVVSGLSAPSGIAVVPNPVHAVGDVFLSSYAQVLKRGIGPLTTSVALLSSYVRDLVVESDGDILAATEAGDVVEIKGSFPHWVTTLESGLGHPRQLTQAPDGTVYVGNADGELYRLDSGGPELLGTFAGLAGLVTDPDGRLYATADGGMILPLEGAATVLSSVGAFRSLAWHPSGSIVGLGGSQVYRVDLSTREASPTGWGSARGDLTIDNVGRVYFTGHAGYGLQLGILGFPFPDNIGLDYGVNPSSVAAFTLPPVLAATDPPTGTRDEAYSYAFTATDPDPRAFGVRFSVVSGSLPPGLTLSEGGRLAGTPTTSGTYGFRVQASNGGRAAWSELIEIEIARIPQAVTFTSAVPDAEDRLPDRTYAPAATGGPSGRPVTFSIAAASNEVCSYDSGTGLVTFHIGGACTVRADQEGDDDYAAAPTVTQSLSIGKLTQSAPTYSQMLPIDVRVGDSFTPTADVSGPGTDVEWFTTNVVPVWDPACEYDSSTGEITFTHAGTCRYYAFRPESDRYGSRSGGNRDITVLPGLLNFRIDGMTTPRVGDTYVLSSDDPDGSYDIDWFLTDRDDSGGAVCRVGWDDDLEVHVASLLRPGTCVLKAVAGIADDFTPHEDSITLTILRAAHPVAFTSTPPTGPYAGDVYTPVATSPATGPVSFAVDDGSEDVCELGAGHVVFLRPGDCVVVAEHPGDDDYEPGSATQTITVVKAPQWIRFTSTVPTDAVVGDQYAPTAMAGSGRMVEFSVDPGSAGVCSIDAGVVSLQHVGDCVVLANQAGDDDYRAADEETQTIEVGKASQSITFTSTAPAGVIGGTHTPTASATSGQAVELSIAPASAAVCSMSAGTVSFEAVGDCVIRANQAGNADHEAAPQVTQTITVGRRSASVLFSSAPPSAPVVGESYQVAVASSPTGGVSLSTSAACSVQGDVVTFDHAGTCAITASRAGSAEYVAAQTIQSVPVSAAATELEVRLSSDETIVATVTVVEPGGGTPTGEVVFSADGLEVGCANLTVTAGGDVVASAVNPFRASDDVSATYLGSTDHLGSSASVARARVHPTISAAITSREPVSEFGWYRTPVRITFTCTIGSAPLVGGCIDRLTLTKNRRGLNPLSVGIAAEDGGSARLDIAGIRIDRTVPRLEVRGVRAGRTYAAKRDPQCVARDGLSGIDRCTVKQQVEQRPDDRTVVRYRVVARDRAGNRTEVTGRYYLR